MSQEITDLDVCSHHNAIETPLPTLIRKRSVCCPMLRLNGRSSAASQHATYRFVGRSVGCLALRVDHPAGLFPTNIAIPQIELSSVIHTHSRRSRRAWSFTISRFVRGRRCAWPDNTLVSRRRLDDALCDRAPHMHGSPLAVRAWATSVALILVCEMPRPNADGWRSTCRCSKAAGSACTSSSAPLFRSLLPRLLRLVIRKLSVVVSAGAALVAVPPPLSELCHPPVSFVFLHDEKSDPFA